MEPKIHLRDATSVRKAKKARTTFPSQDAYNLGEPGVSPIVRWFATGQLAEPDFASRLVTFEVPCRRGCGRAAGNSEPEPPTSPVFPPLHPVSGPGPFDTLAALQHEQNRSVLGQLVSRRSPCVAAESRLDRGLDRMRDLGDGFGLFEAG